MVERELSLTRVAQVTPAGRLLDRVERAEERTGADEQRVVAACMGGAGGEFEPSWSRWASSVAIVSVRFARMPPTISGTVASSTSTT